MNVRNGKRGSAPQGSPGPRAQKNAAIRHARASVPKEQKALAEVHFVQGRAAFVAGDMETAIDKFHRGIDFDPLNGDALVEIGWAYFGKYSLSQAVQAVDLARKCGARGYDYDIVKGWVDLYAVGAAQSRRRAPGIIKVAERLIQQQPDRAQAHALLAAAHRALGNQDECVAHARRALFRDPIHAPAWYELGCALYDQDRKVEAIDAYEHGREGWPAYVPSYLGLGMAYLHLEDLVRATEVLEQSYALAPTAWATQNNLAIVYEATGRWQESLALLDAVAAGHPDELGPRYNRGYSLFAQGRLAEGWAAYDLGVDSGARKPVLHHAKPRWQGEDVSDKTILVHHEQGIGDVMMFASCLDELIEVAGHVIVEVPPRLATIMARSFPGATVRVSTFDGDGKPTYVDYDVQTPIGSLLRWFRPTLDAFPDHQGYLTPDPAKVAMWRERLDALGPGPKVGVSWRSKLLTTDRLSHYTTLHDWEPVFAIPGAHYVNLQYGERFLFERELDTLEESTGVHVHRWPDLDYTDDIEGIAALTAALDVVVSAGTTSARLSSALGVPTVMIVAGTPGAFPQMGTDHEPIYPRQKVALRRLGTPWEPTIATAVEMAGGLLAEQGLAVTR